MKKLLLLFLLLAQPGWGATLYWYGGSGNWSAATGHWSTNSGNSPAADHIAPVSSDSCIVDSGSGASPVITIDSATAICYSLTTGAPTSGNLTITTDANKTRVLTIGSGGLSSTGTPRIGGASSVNRLLLASVIGSAKPLSDKANGIVFSNIDFRDIAFNNGQIIFFGDSINNNSAAQQTAVYYGMALLPVNKGVFGNTTTQMVARIAADVTGNPQARYVEVLGGYNDIAGSAGAATIEGNLATIYAAAKAANLTVVAATIMPFGTSAGWTAGKQAVLEAVNTWIKTAANIDYVIDAYAVMGNGPSNPQNMKPAYIRDDGIHPNDAGSLAYIQAVYAGTTWTGIANRDLSAITGLSGDCGNNSGATLTPPRTNYFYKASGGGPWAFSTSTYWYDDATHASQVVSRVPLPQDTAAFINGFGAGSMAVRNDMPRTGSIDFTGANNSPAFRTDSAASVFGSVTLIPAMTLSADTSIYTFEGRGVNTLTSAGLTWTKPMYFQLGGGTMNLADALTVGAGQYADLTLYYGTFKSNGYAITAPKLRSTGTSTRSLNLAGSTVTLTFADTTSSSTGSVVNLTATGMTLTSTGSTIKLTDATATTKTFAGAGLSFGTIWFAGGAGTGEYDITGSNTFSVLKDDGSGTHSVKFTRLTTQAIADWQIGTPTSRAGNTNVITLDTVDGAGTFTINKSTPGHICADYLNIQRSVAGGTGALWYAGLNSTNNNGAGSGWLFQKCFGGGARRMLLGIP